MRISATVGDVADDLAALGSLGDEAIADAPPARLARAMEGPIAARLLQILAQAAAELDATLSDAHVEVRLAGDEAELVLVAAEHPAADETVDEGDSDARITLRLPSLLKSRVEAAAAGDGVSVNTWIVRALGHQARSTPRPPNVGRRLRGYGRS